jgi:hypothetical protein
LRQILNGKTIRPDITTFLLARRMHPRTHKFIKGARKELLIYDPKISDPAMLRALEERQRTGVTIRIIGRVSGGRLPASELKRIRLHTRALIRDPTQAFIGSQSLRQVELDARREIGDIFRDGAVVRIGFEPLKTTGQRPRPKNWRRNLQSPKRDRKSC